MKLLLILTVFLVSLTSYAQCTGARVDDKKVMLFMDMNNSALEIAAAQRAACARGQKLLVLPKNHREYNVLTNKVQNDMKAYERCLGGNGNCEAQIATYTASYQQLETFKASLPDASEQLRTEMAALKSSGSKLVNFTISGHDGGGTYSGHKGEIDRADMLEIMGEFPEVNDVRSVMLLGCYTTVPNEVIHWKSIFPKGKLIAGYDGVAPASDKVTGHNYLEDLLRKEPQILAQADQARLNNYLKQSIRGLSIMNTGIYVELDCEGPDKLFYGLDDTSRRMRSLDIKECDGKEDLVRQIGEDITRYYTGASEPPADTRNGELRRIYNQGRRYEHCGAHLDMEYSMSQAFNMLFYDGLKKNFAAYYRDDLARAGEIIGEITAEELSAPYLKQIQETDALIKIQDDLAALAGTPEYAAYLNRKIAEGETRKAALASELGDLINGEKKPQTIAEAEKLAEYQSLIQYEGIYKAYAQATDPAADVKQLHEDSSKMYKEHQSKLRLSIAQLTAKPENYKVWIPNAQNLSTKTRKETLENLHRINTLTLMPGLSPRKMMALKWLHQVSEFHLQTMENPFSWHEYTGRIPERPLGADNMHLDDWLKMAGGN